jgi:hypothetical protein
MDLNSFRRGMHARGRRQVARPDYRVLVATLEAMQSASPAARALRGAPIDAAAQEHTPDAKGGPKSEERMIENQKIRPAQVIGPLGEPLTIDSLPPPSTTRWVVRRKAEVVSAVNGGLLSVDEACERYSLTLEEFAGWQRAVDRSGMPGLRVTRIQHYKSLYERQQKF